MSHLLNPDPQACIWLIDANIYVFRAWFLRKTPVHDSQGRPIHAVTGFLRFVQQLLQEQQPYQIGFAFDSSLQHSERKNIDPNYKANRQPAPEELRYQFQLCRSFLSAAGLVQVSSISHEADDIIGSWAQQLRSSDKQILIISGDKDLAQVIRAKDIWWDYKQRSALNAGGVKSRFGVWPEQIPDQLALAGDKADNIAGVPGVGMATAAKLLKHFQTVEQLYERLAEVGKLQIHGAKRLPLLLAQHEAAVRRARQLTEIRCHVTDIPLDLRRGPKDLSPLQTLMSQLDLSEQQQQFWLQF